LDDPAKVAMLTSRVVDKEANIDRMNTSETRRDAQRVKTNREELTELIGQTVSEDGAKEVFPGFSSPVRKRCTPFG
jgi:hypothetical protein